MNDSNTPAVPVSRLAPARSFISNHRFYSALMLLALVSAIYGSYKASTAVAAGTRYFVQNVSTDTVISTVSGTGAVTAENQVDLTTQASGNITGISVKVGQRVAAGQLIASQDPGTTGFELQSAKLNLEKAMETGSDSMVTDQATLASAQVSLTSAQDAGVNEITSAYGNLDQVMETLQQLYAMNGYLDETNNNRSTSERAIREQAFEAYDSANQTLLSAEAAGRSIPRDSSPAQIQVALTTQYTAAKAVANATAQAQQVVATFRTDDNAKAEAGKGANADTAYTNVSSTVTTANGLVTAVLAAAQAITDAQTAITNAQIALSTATGNTGTIDVRSAQLAVAQAQKAYKNNFVTAPFAGTIASVDTSVGTLANSGTKVATLVTTQQLATITLNEVDVAKVQVGQKATLTFDALPDLSISGTVAEVGGTGTVTQGVVDFTVKIAFDTQDTRIKPTMTVSANIQTAVAQDTIVVPASAIKTANGESYVQAFTPPLDTTASSTIGYLSKTAPQRVLVTTGITDSTNTQILSGLTDGEQIVVKTTAGGTTTASAKTAAAAATTRSTTGRGGEGFGGAPGGL